MSSTNQEFDKLNREDATPRGQQSASNRRKQSHGKKRPDSVPSGASISTKCGLGIEDGDSTKVIAKECSSLEFSAKVENAHTSSLPASASAEESLQILSSESDSLVQQLMCSQCQAQNAAQSPAISTSPLFQSPTEALAAVHHPYSPTTASIEDAAEVVSLGTGDKVNLNLLQENVHTSPVPASASAEQSLQILSSESNLVGQPICSQCQSQSAAQSPAISTSPAFQPPTEALAAVHHPYSPTTASIEDAAEMENAHTSSVSASASAEQSLSSESDLVGQPICSQRQSQSAAQSPSILTSPAFHPPTKALTVMHHLQGPTTTSMEEIAIVANMNQGPHPSGSSRVNITPVLAGLAPSSDSPIKDAPHAAFISFNTTEIHVHTDSTPTLPASKGAVPKDTSWISGSPSAFDITTRLHAFQDTVDDAWHSVPSLFGIFGYVASVFRAPLRSFIAVIFWAVIVLLILWGGGLAACQNSYIAFFSICHANQNSPLCSIAYSHNIMAFCPGPIKVNTTEFFDSTYAYLKVINIQDEVRNLPQVLHDYRLSMESHYEEIVTGDFGNVTELSVAINEYTEGLYVTTNEFYDLNHQIFILSLKIDHAVHNVMDNLMKLETRNLLQFGLTDAVFELLGISTEPSVEAYSEVWIDFLSESTEPADKLFSLTENLLPAFDTLERKLKRISLLSREGNKKQESLLRSHGILRRLFGSDEITDLRDTIRILNDLRDGCKYSRSVILEVQQVLSEIKNSSKSLIEALEKRTFKAGWDMRTQIDIITEVLARVTQAKQQFRQKERDDAEAWHQAARRRQI